MQNLREFILNIDESIEEVPKKYYVAYRTAQNFVCVQVYKNKITLFLKLDAKSFDSLPENARDVSKIGHFGTGDLEFVIKGQSDLKEAQRFIRMAFEKIGG